MSSNRPTAEHPHVIAPNLRSRFDPAELGERLRRSDIVAVDLDECVYPGFTQSDLGYLMFFAIAARPLDPSDRRFLPQMIAGGAFVRKVALLRRLGHTWPTRELMQRYEQSMRGIPEDYFLSQVTRIPGRSNIDAIDVLRLLGRRAPLGLVSLGIDVIVAEYIRQLNGDGQPVVRFADSNRILFVDGDREKRVFQGYGSPLLTGPEDKRRALEARMAQFQASCPLVIGNSGDEAAMASLASRRGGISIGIRPSKPDSPAFDVCVLERSWRSLRMLLELG
jgi:hypothetical protein